MSAVIDRLTEPPCDMDYLRIRCRECAESGCWDWAMHKRDGKWPTIFFRLPLPDGTKKNEYFYVRHLVYWLKTGRKPGVGRKRVLTTTCETTGCINPDHLEATTRRKLNQRVAGYQSELANRQKLAKARRVKSKLSDQDVADIRGSDLTPKDLATKYGVSRSYIHMLLKNEWRKVYSSPFAGLFASNDSSRRAA